RRPCCVGRHADPLPVESGVGIHRSRKWNGHLEVLAQALELHGMGPTSGRLAHDRHALLILEVEAELLGRRERALAREKVDILAHVSRTWNPGQRPRLKRDVVW